MRRERNKLSVTVFDEVSKQGSPVRFRKSMTPTCGFAAETLWTNANPDQITRDAAKNMEHKRFFIYLPVISRLKPFYKKHPEILRHSEKRCGFLAPIPGELHRGAAIAEPVEKRHSFTEVLIDERNN
jgi:hypothetical protein